MSQENESSPFKLTPRLMVRVIVYASMVYWIYKETGIFTALLLGLVFLENGLVKDWMAMNTKFAGIMSDGLTLVTEQLKSILKPREEKDEG